MNTDVLTGLRFVAAAIVVIFHFGRDVGLVSSTARGFLTAGPQMVGFFFVLSGFIMSYVYLRRPCLNFTEYCVARLARILPVYLLALVVLFLLRPFGFWPFVSDLTLLKAWFPQYALQGNIPGWSISVELFFYALFPFVLALLKELKPSVSGFSVVALLLWLFSQLILGNLYFSDFYKAGGRVSHALIFYFPLSHISSFLVGVAAAYAMISGPRRPQAALNGPVGLVMALLLGYLIYFMLNNRIADILGFKVLNAAGGLSPLYALFVFFVLASSRYFTWLLANRVALILGEASYALYILQLPVFLAFNRFIAPAYSISGDMAFYIYFIFLVVISIFIFFFLERPLRDLLNRVYRRFSAGGGVSAQVI